MKNTDTREVIMISIRLSTKNLQTDYYPFILEPEARHLFLKELASHFFWIFSSTWMRYF